MNKGKEERVLEEVKEYVRCVVLPLWEAIWEQPFFGGLRKFCIQYGGKSENETKTDAKIAKTSGRSDTYAEVPPRLAFPS